MPSSEDDLAFLPPCPSQPHVVLPIKLATSLSATSERETGPLNASTLLMNNEVYKVKVIESSYYMSKAFNDTGLEG